MTPDRNRPRLIVLVSAVVLVVLTWAFSVSAQSAEIRGRVVDEQQRAVPGATITLTNPKTGLTRTDSSDGEGLYRFAGLPPAVYDLRASLLGFTTVEHSATTLQVGAIVHLDFALRVAPIAESVSIAHSGPLIETSSATVSGVVEPRRIEELPLNGRQFATSLRRFPALASPFIAIPPKGRSTRHRSVAGPAGTSTIRLTAETTTTIPSAVSCRCSRSIRSKSSGSRSRHTVQRAGDRAAAS